MSEQPITIEEIMTRIKSTMDVAKKNRKSIEPQRPPLNQNYDMKYMRLLSEIEQNNRNWNVSAEHPITSHRPTLGRFIVFGKKLVRKLLRWYINPAFDKQSNFNGSVTRSLNNVRDILAELTKDIEYVNEQSSKFSSELDTDILNKIKKVFSEEKDQIIDNTIINNILITQEKLEQNIGRLNEKLDAALNLSNNFVHHEKFEQMEANVQRNVDTLSSKLTSEIENVNKNVEKLDDLIMLLNARIKKSAIVKARPAHNSAEPVKMPALVSNAVEPKDSRVDIDYFLFEQKFRGARTAIMERQRDYLPLFANRTHILDIGCGRGEFIELLQKEYNVTVKGIDINSDMVGYCQERGFDVELIDAMEYLETLEENSLDGVFMAQVIEHLTSDQAMQLINSVYRVLKPGGLFVVETINVQSVYAMSNWFYMDPTHIKPVHPVTLKFIFQGSSYSQVEVKYLSPVPDKGVPHLEIEGIDLGRFNESLNDLNGLLYGYQDYAICAYK
ncbi:class I SAM-dependent methyltransferase [Paenibacillus xerothermodurans]|uniref:Class I SAM-dependent methyltransferase n=1 Tax=Paenibacillus xerothermodurans TaxID=1977292 RepID=A0A2W1NA65_PAEXE|nr:class I SAM-dependent methyltransferase [Paenibacillus xerothermodurans]PZE20814.1 class I SAM-dependent methyltransferase [Paenibacillus xerothermodurans]